MQQMKATADRGATQEHRRCSKCAHPVGHEKTEVREVRQRRSLRRVVERLVQREEHVALTGTEEDCGTVVVSASALRERMGV